MFGISGDPLQGVSQKFPQRTDILILTRQNPSGKIERRISGQSNRPVKLFLQHSVIKIGIGNRHKQ